MKQIADVCSVLHGTEVVHTGTRNECLAYKSVDPHGWAYSVNTPIEEVLRRFWNAGQA